MKYNCYVKHNGVLYAPGTDVPEGETPKAETKVEKKAEETVEEPGLTRTQIQQMNGAQLKETATQLGVEFSEDVTNRELKQLIMGKLGI